VELDRKIELCLGGKVLLGGGEMYSTEEGAKAISETELGRIINRMSVEDIVEVLREHFNEEGRAQLSIGLLVKDDEMCKKDCLGGRVQHPHKH
jgi:hypothetical protein